MNWKKNYFYEKSNFGLSDQLSQSAQFYFLISSLNQKLQKFEEFSSIFLHILIFSFQIFLPARRFVTIWQYDTLTVIKSFRYNSCQMTEKIFYYLNSNEIYLSLILFTRVKLKFMNPRSIIFFFQEDNI